MRTLLLSVALATVLGACGGSGSSVSDDEMGLRSALIAENAEHYTFGCIDVGGQVFRQRQDFSGEGWPSQIADDIDLGVRYHLADSWLVGTESVAFTTFYDPASGPTNASDFIRVEVDTEAGQIICLTPRAYPPGSAAAAG